MARARLSTLLVGLTLTALSVSAPSSSTPAAVPVRIHRAPVVEGCFVPPPEPVAVPPCDDARGAR